MRSLNRHAVCYWGGLQGQGRDARAGERREGGGRVYVKDRGLFFPIPSIASALLFSLHPTSSLNNSGQGSYSRLFSPSPAALRALHFYHRRNSVVASLVGLHLIDLRRSDGVYFKRWIPMSYEHHVDKTKQVLQSARYSYLWWEIYSFQYWRDKLI